MLSQCLNQRFDRSSNSIVFLNKCIPKLPNPKSNTEHINNIYVHRNLIIILSNALHPSFINIIIDENQLLVT